MGHMIECVSNSVCFVQLVDLNSKIQTRKMKAVDSLWGEILIATNRS